MAIEYAKGKQTTSAGMKVIIAGLVGAVSEGGNVQSWNVPFFQTKAPITSTLRVQNTGNLHFQASSVIKIKSMLGGSSTTINDQHFVLPQTTRAIPIKWTNGPSLGLYKVSGTVSFLHQKETLPDHTVLLMPVIVIIIVVAAVVLLVAAVGGAIMQRRRRR